MMGLLSRGSSERGERANLVSVNCIFLRFVLMSAVVVLGAMRGSGSAA